MRLSRSIAALVLIFVTPAALRAQTVKIVHMNVGQGDATLILGPRNTAGERVSVLFDSGDIPFGGDQDGGALVAEVLQDHGLQQIDFFIASHYDADHIGGVVTGLAHIHGSSFLLGPDGAPGSPGDDDGDGQADWLDTNMIQPDPEELGTGDDVRVATFVDRGDTSNPGTQTYDKYVGMAAASRNRVCSLTGRTWSLSRSIWGAGHACGRSRPTASSGTGPPVWRT